MARRPSTVDRLQLADIGNARIDYAMAKRSGAQTRVRRGVPSQGAGADYHYRNESDWLWMQELAWEFFRNNMIVGSIVDRAVEYTVQDGFGYDPQTGDPGLDQELKDWHADWREKPEECDPAGESTFIDQEEQVHRATLVGGDCFAVPVEDGTVSLLEGYLCRSPSRKVKESVVHGVELVPGSRRRSKFWFADEPIGAFETVLKRQLTPTAAWYHDELTGREERQVFHVRYPKRLSQTRGITAFAPLFNPADYVDDIEFLEMVRKRASALFVFIRERASTFDPKYLAAEMKLGSNVTDAKVLADDAERLNKQYSAVSAGSVLDTWPGEKVTLNSANIPAPEHHAHVDKLLTYVGVNLGMPLVMVLMDASQGNFSSIRGAVEMARNGFRRNQRRLAQRFHTPYMRFKILKRAESDPSLAQRIRDSYNPGAKINPFWHRWNLPTWPYIQPVEDSTTDLLRQSNMLSSPTRICNERGVEWSEIVTETVRDRSQAIAAAMAEAQKLNAQYGLVGTPGELTWRDLAPLAVPERVQVSIAANPVPPPKPEPSKGSND